MTKKKTLPKKKVSKPTQAKSNKPLPKKKSASAKPLAKKTIKPATNTKAVKVAKKSPAKSKAQPIKTVKPVAKKLPANSASKNVSKQKPKEVAAKTIFTRGALQQTFVSRPPKKKKVLLSPFLKKQQQRLLALKDMLLDSMSGVARGHLHEGSDSSAFGEHQADAGSDSYDRDFALSILSQEQNSLYEIDEALQRIEEGTYGICQLSNKQIPRARLEARPFTRYTVECQAELEKRQHVSGIRLPVSALFGATEEENETEEEENFGDISKE